MRLFRLLVITLLVVLPLMMSGCGKPEKGDGTSTTPAAMSGVTILSPQNDQVLASGKGVKLVYSVHLSPTGNHLHIYVDGQSPIISRNVIACPCSVTLPPLTAGPHEVAVKEATVSHALTGVESTVRFIVK